MPADRWETARSEAKKKAEEQRKKTREYWDAHSYIREKDGKRVLDRSKLDEERLDYRDAGYDMGYVFRKKVFGI